MSDSYMTGAEAYKRLEREEAKGQGRSAVLYQWWLYPRTFPDAPFQYTTKSGESFDASLVGRPWMQKYADYIYTGQQVDCGCLLVIKGGGTIAPTRRLTKAIIADPLIPASIYHLAHMSKTKFIRVWNRLAAWQRALRLGLTPEQMREPPV